MISSQIHQGFKDQGIPPAFSNLSRPQDMVLLWQMLGNRVSEMSVDTYPVISLDTVSILPEGCTIECDSNYDKRVGLVWNKFLEGNRSFLVPKIETRLGLDVSVDLAVALHRCEVPYGLVVRNFLVGNPNQIPAEWKGRTITFRGTILRYHDGLGYPSLICRKDGGCFPSRSMLQISTCVGAGRGLL